MKKSVKFRKVVNNRQNSPTKGKVYGRAVYSNIVHTADLCEEIEEKCTLTDVDVTATVTALVSSMAKHLCSGDKVVLDGFGSFKVGIRTSPADTAEKFGVGNIKGTYIIYQPVTELVNGHRVKSLLKDIKVEEMPKYSGLEDDDDSNNPSGEGNGGNTSAGDNTSTGGNKGTGGSTSSGDSKGDSGSGSTPGSGSSSGDNIENME